DDLLPHLRVDDRLEAQGLRQGDRLDQVHRALQTARQRDGRGHRALGEARAVHRHQYAFEHLSTSRLEHRNRTAPRLTRTKICVTAGQTPGPVPPPFTQISLLVHLSAVPYRRRNRKERAMLHSMLIPLDGSPLAERVLAPATALARRLDIPVTLLRLVPS